MNQLFEENNTEVRVLEIPWRGPKSEFLKKVDECDRLVPGLEYLVPCVAFVDMGGADIFWPIIPLPHRDGHNQRNIDLGPHVHYDLRFLSWPQVQHLIEEIGDEVPQEIDLHHWGRTMRLIRRIFEDSILIEWRPRRCVLRNFPDRAKYVAWDELRDIFAHSRMCGQRCPHQGYDLSKIKPNKTGAIECPLHGLLFEPDTGKAIPVARPKRKEP